MGNTGKVVYLSKFQKADELQNENEKMKITIRNQSQLLSTSRRRIKDLYAKLVQSQEALSACVPQMEKLLNLVRTHQLMPNNEIDMAFQILETSRYSITEEEQWRDIHR